MIFCFRLHILIKKSGPWFGWYRQHCPNWDFLTWGCHVERCSIFCLLRHVITLWQSLLSYLIEESVSSQVVWRMWNWLTTTGKYSTETEVEDYYAAPVRIRWRYDSNVSDPTSKTIIYLYTIHISSTDRMRGPNLGTRGNHLYSVFITMTA